MRGEDTPGLDYDWEANGQEASGGTFENRTILSRAFWGEETTGTWTITIEDMVDNGNEGTLESLTLQWKGDLAGDDTTYYFTDDWAMMNEANGGVPVLDDALGQNSINAAALMAPVLMRLSAGSSSEIGGRTAFSLSDTSVFTMGIGTDQGDTLIGADGNEKLYGMQGADILSGAAGDDKLYGGTGADTLSGDTGDDRLVGNEGDDLLEGGMGDDTIWAGADDTGDDRVFGGDGNDLLFNGAGNDTVVGGDGDDTLWGGAGDDALTGGAGADTFAFTATNGSDVVTDFDGSEDILLLESSGFADLDALKAAAMEDDTGVTISFGDTVIILTGINLDDLTADNVML